MAARDEIVQPWMSPDPTLEGYQYFKQLSPTDKELLIQREAEEYGIQKPKGYNVSFHYNPHVEYHHFGSRHPMKPWRLTLTKQLVFSYGLEYAMDCYETLPARQEELEIFHDREYINFLRKITPDNKNQFSGELAEYQFEGDTNDCPVFDGLYNYVCLYSGASINAAQTLINGQSDIAINWSGGLHHAKKKGASGFCYVNDIVLAIQHLLEVHPRVLYIDIDIHHGDGVEQAFESTDRVFTLSYHRYGYTRETGQLFFPGTGSDSDTGPDHPSNRGFAHTLNVPLQDGIDDEQYMSLFDDITGAVIDKYQPTVILLQCGADSLGGDRLGRFNLNIKAHGHCVEFVMKYHLPLLLVGGGGYTPRNVARAWCHETSVAVGAELHNEIPTHVPYYKAFEGAEHGDSLLYPDLAHIRGKRHDNDHKDAVLRQIRERAFENLRYLEAAPSVKLDGTRGLLSEIDLARIRAEVDKELQDLSEDQERAEVEATRRKRERNTGGRGEYRFR